MLSEKEYIELVNALIDEGFSEDSAKKIIERSEDEGLLEPPFYELKKITLSWFFLSIYY